MYRVGQEYFLSLVLGTNTYVSPNLNVSGNHALNNSLSLTVRLPMLGQPFASSSDVLRRPLGAHSILAWGMPDASIRGLNIAVKFETVLISLENFFPVLE